MLKDFFYFNRQDRIVTVLLLAVITGLHFVNRNLPKKPDTTELPPDSLVWNGPVKARDSVRYRQSYQKTDSVKSYGKKTEYRQYSRERSQYRYSGERENDTVVKDTAFVPKYRVKQRPETAVDINAADSLTLTGLPGIGAWTASRIMEYREELGGFYKVEQLLEINGLNDSLLQWFMVSDQIPIRKMRVNELSVALLRRHPYIDFYQARAIVEYRREYGKLKGPGQLSLFEEFTDRDLERLAPYLDYN